MGNIRVMDSHLANMIAAGEVVERPSSIIKELVENSIDAHAKHVEVEIYQAGRKKIVVKDDGDGMDKDDAVIAFKRHASSKLLDEYQLFKIKTMGFRGEALPSIAAVSKVTMYTAKEKGVGSKVTIVDENIVREDHPCAKGTIFEIEELFYNTPVRLKYLKTDYTEVASCLEVMQRLALSFPNVSFDFYIDGKLSFSTTGRGDLLEVIARLYGNDIAKKMLPISFSADGFDINGFMAKPEVTRSTRYYMITILNQRNVYIPNVQKAIISGYGDYIFNSKYPFVILNLRVDHSLVDVNVHPSKKEVRLSNDGEIASATEKIIKEELRKLNSFHDVTIKVQKKEVEQAPLFDLNTNRINVEVNRPFVEQKVNDTITFNEPKKETSILLDMIDLDEELTIENHENEVKEEPKVKDIPNLKVIGQLHKTYIVLEGEDGFYLCDQHAANERINYERFNKILNSHIDVTELLVPIVMSFSPSDIHKLTDEKINMLKEIGLSIEPFGLNTIRVSSIPVFIKEQNEEVYIEELINQVINDDKINIVALRKHVIATMACKASIKANDKLDVRQMEDLIAQLFTCDNPTTCPHGRPTIVHFTSYDVEKMFKRSGI